MKTLIYYTSLMLIGLGIYGLAHSEERPRGAWDYRPRGSANAQAHARAGQKHQKHNPGHKIVRKKIGR